MATAARDIFRNRDYVEIALVYIEDVLDGRVTAGRLTRLACERQLRDLERAAGGDPDFPYVFDPVAAARVCRFKEGLPHVQGEWAKRRELIVLEPWQIFADTTLFGWVHRDTGLRRFRTAYKEVARKNAKSTDAAGDLLYMLAADDEAGAEVYCAATKRDQASVVFNIGRNMARRSPSLRNRFGLQAQNYKLSVPAADAEAKALDAKGSTQDGLNPHAVINDELHAWKGRGLYEVLETAQGARSQPLILNITTAGFDRAGICYEQRAYAIRVLEGKATDDTVFALIYTLDDDDDPFDEAVWPKANPNLGVSVYLDGLRAQAAQAKASPAKLNGFLTKRMNIWCSAATAWMDMRKWDSCADPTLRLADFAGEEAIAALDLATRKDICSRILLFERGDKLYLFARHYAPRAAVDAGENAAYAGWEKEGWLTVTEGEVTDQDRIKDDLLEDAALVRLTEIVFDRWQAAKLMGELGDLNFEVVDLTNSVANMSEPMKELEAQVLAATLVHQGDPVMGWMIGNVTCRLDEKGNIFPRKETKDSPLKIDGPVAAIMGLNRVMAHRDEGTTITVPAGYSLVAAPPAAEGRP